MRGLKGLAVSLLVIGMASPAWATGPLVDSHDVNQTQLNAPVTVNAPVATGGKADAKSTSLSGAASHSSSKSGVKGSGNSDVAVDASTGDIPAQAPAVFAPNLTASPEACMGSTSVGGSAGFASISLGISVGSTWKNHDCELRAFSREIASLPPNIATPVRIALLSQNDDVKRAFQDANVEIPSRKVAAAMIQPPAAVAYNPAPLPLQGGVQVEKRNVSQEPAQVVCKDGELKVKAGNGEYFCRAR